MSKWFIYIVFWLVPICLWGQHQDSVRTIILSDVVVYEELLKTSETGLSEVVIDSLSLVQMNGTSLSDLFRNTAAAQIRSYGTNGPTLPSFRGTGASHTAILWNGINLQSPLTGGQDLSLLPVSFINEVKLQKGGTSSLYGSGAIGGSVQLNNKTVFNQGFEGSTQQTIGSFGNHYQAYGLNWSGQKFTSSTLLFHRTLDNDFTYERNSNPPTRETRSNAAINQKGLMQQNDWQINHRNLIGIKLWYQDNRFEIPNSIIASTNNEAVQNDEFFRSLLSWNFDLEHFSMVYKQAYISHALEYLPSVGAPANNDYSSWINRVSINWDLPKNNHLIAGLNHNFEKTAVDAFGSDMPTRNSTAFFSSFRTERFDQKLVIALSARQELVDGDLKAFSPSLGVDCQVLKGLFFKGNVSRNFRLPTFNDLYWQGSGAIGNPDLKPETSFNYESGINYNFLDQSSHFQLETGFTYYNYLVEDWIQWQPVAGSGWTPINLKKVRSRGLELQASGKYKSTDFYSSLSAIYNYTKTTNEEIESGANQNERGKQLIYTPKHEGSVNIQVGYKNSTLSYNYTYTGKQYTEAENQTRFALEAYQVMNLNYNQNIKWKKMHLGLQATVNNLLDISYENRRGYPMYGRNYSIGLEIKFKTKT